MCPPQIMIGLAAKVNHMSTLYYTIAMVYAVMMAFSLVLGIWLVFTRGVTPFVGVAFGFCLFSYIIGAAFHQSLIMVRGGRCWCCESAAGVTPPSLPPPRPPRCSSSTSSCCPPS